MMQKVIDSIPLNQQVKQSVNNRENQGKKKLIHLLLLLVVSILVWMGIIVFDDRKYIFISIAIAVASSSAYYLSFERRDCSTRKLVILAILIALCVIGRFIFLPIPGFKPVTAIVIMSGMYFGSQAGFLTGSMAALTSNLLFGQGPWTPFQMLAWGLIGWFAGLVWMQKLLQRKVPLLIYGAISGGVFSLIMDSWSTIAVDGTFHWARFQAKVLTSLPFMVIYAVSNVVFLLLIRRPMGDKLKRIQVKYGLSSY